MISVIIPTYNEADHIAETINNAKAADGKDDIEFIVVDGGSSDATVSIAIDTGAKAIASNRKGRASQMNEGARIATGDILYFLHADTIPPKNFTTYILQ